MKYDFEIRLFMLDGNNLDELNNIYRYRNQITFSEDINNNGLNYMYAIKKGISKKGHYYGSNDMIGVIDTLKSKLTKTDMNNLRIRIGKELKSIITNKILRSI